jgi:hypothetical protein
MSDPQQERAIFLDNAARFLRLEAPEGNPLSRED